MEYIENLAAAEHDAFVSKHPLCNLLQSSKWADVKDNWNHMFVGVKHKGELIASSLILIKKLPMSFSIFYISRGPIMDYENENLVSFFFENLKITAKKKHAIYVTLDPAIHCNDYQIKEANEERYEQIPRILDILRANGLQFKGFTKHIDETIQPRYHANVYRNDDLKEQLSKSARKALQITEKKKLQVEAYGIEKISEFTNVMHFTEERKQIQLRGEGYFKKLMQIYKEDAVIYLAKLPLEELYLESLEKLEQVEADLASCPKNAKKKRFTLEEQQVSLRREVKELKENMEHDGKETFIAGALCVKYGLTAELLYAGMNDTYKRYMAPYATFFKCMEWSFEKGCNSCNMGGIEGELKGGLTTFKANFSPLINEYIGEFDLPFHKMLYKATRIAMKLRKR